MSDSNLLWSNVFLAFYRRGVCKYFLERRNRAQRKFHYGATPDGVGRQLTVALRDFNIAPERQTVEQVS